MIGKFTGIRRAGSIVIESTGAERAREEAPRILLSLLSSLIVPYKPIPRSPPSSFRRVRVRVCSAWRDPAFRIQSSRSLLDSDAKLRSSPTRTSAKSATTIVGDRSARRGRRISLLLSLAISIPLPPPTFVYESFVRGSQTPAGARSLSAYLICK